MKAFLVLFLLFVTAFSHATAEEKPLTPTVTEQEKKLVPLKDDENLPDSFRCGEYFILETKPERILRFRLVAQAGKSVASLLAVPLKLVSSVIDFQQGTPSIKKDGDKTVITVSAKEASKSFACLYAENE
ncbi:MAG: hypothetical protein COT92_00745 [Candidatus Doudnabacteria bacterium CG10_big_fil_rev_8_21_14_0_10_42_18]|uniref:Uncharacterized protein n=1 Tax=Candidatus Doudnabacteria bacterium CG10_big_fil_rev_8_21_14_0_10_42_18 TaxID=1974552 RepID=A0A2H0VDR9_9BACT|nr:MAG: hypothetical protein COT92_00745 [Candidatus Doudnabacteria bacterium CG10_big_fil_rev_8_21_14_0_10_42_18]